VNAPLLYTRKENLRVAMTAKAMAQPFELLSQLDKVVDLAIERDHPSSRLRRHGLMAVRRQVDDRQATVTERDAGRRIDPRTSIVGPAIGDRVSHRDHRVVRL